jgi:hypothetical protein
VDLVRFELTTPSAPWSHSHSRTSALSTRGLRDRDLDFIWTSFGPHALFHACLDLERSNFREAWLRRDHPHDSRTREVEREIEHYNLDLILVVGYRVRSERGTQFRRCPWPCDTTLRGNRDSSRELPKSGGARFRRAYVSSGAVQPSARLLKPQLVGRHRAVCLREQTGAGVTAGGG